MGSVGAKSVKINVTGFKKFQGVDENPTEIIVNKLRNYVESKGLPAGVTLGVCAVLETAGDGALPQLYKVLESGIGSNDEKIVWLHLGVNGGASMFAIEHQAVNEATFCCPDELGWQPLQLPIIPDDGGISQRRKTSCSVEAIVEFLKRKGFDATISNDAGRFVCNFVYYHSLLFADQKGHKSLFVHIPPFSRIDEETQMKFIVALLEAIASTC
ncbi:putative pyroglutamyl peptidase [Handroanthus impetiginosus]|uniref:Pyroglutamyl-peptidase I n=1 Tax=Handroanthus impetiginosus TaxID=429701 RepID=A0A2G9GWW8_9LAMI|nr:putative pyroglutamyl peptidase [Handroanthus impetiginosus]